MLQLLSLFVECPYLWNVLICEMSLPCSGTLLPIPNIPRNSGAELIPIRFLKFAQVGCHKYCNYAWLTQIAPWLPKPCFLRSINIHLWRPQLTVYKHPHWGNTLLEDRQIHLPNIIHPMLKIWIKLGHGIYNLQWQLPPHLKSTAKKRSIIYMLLGKVIQH
jgi:hypothetical protein